MRIYFKKEDKIKIVEKILLFLCPLFLIVGTSSIYSILVNFKIRSTFCFTVVLFLLLLCFFIQKQLDFHKLKKILFFLLVYYIFLMIFYFVNQIYSLTNFILLFGLCFPIFLTIFVLHKKRKEMIKTILKNYFFILLFFNIISLFFFLFASVLKIIPPLNQEVIRWGGEKLIPNYYYLYFETQFFQIFHKEVIRNSSIFPEAPMFILHLVVALSAYIYILHGKNKKALILYIITIFTTFSTIGIGYIFLIVVERGINRIRNKRFVPKKYFIGFGTITFLLLLIFSIFGLKRIKTISYTRRVDDYIVCTKTFLEHPIFGCGFDNKNEIRKQMDLKRKDKGLSNSIMPILAEGGIYFTFFYLLPIFLLTNKLIRQKKWDDLKFMYLMFLLLFQIIFSYTPLMIFLLSLGYQEIFSELREKNDG